MWPQCEQSARNPFIFTDLGSFSVVQCSCGDPDQWESAEQFKFSCGEIIVESQRQDASLQARSRFNCWHHRVSWTSLHITLGVHRIIGMYCWSVVQSTLPSWDPGLDSLRWESWMRPWAFWAMLRRVQKKQRTTTVTTTKNFLERDDDIGHAPLKKYKNIAEPSFPF